MDVAEGVSRKPVRFGAAVGLNRTDWPAVRDACLRAEASGWDSVWVEDHLLADEGDWHDPKLEGWATLAALAVLTSRVRLGHLVLANTLRNPGLTAKLASTLDHLSDGRMVLGIGGGWFEREHEAFGIDFGSGPGERLDRLDESVRYIRRLLDGETFSEVGRFYAFTDAVCAPAPVQRRLPILIGGNGRRKTLRTVATSADIWNTYEPEPFFRSLEVLKEHCQNVGRDFTEIEVTLCQVAVIRDDPAQAIAVHKVVAAEHGLAGDTPEDPPKLQLDLWGSPEQVAEGLQPFIAAGVDEVIVVFRSPFDLETVERIGEVRSALEVRR